MSDPKPMETLQDALVRLRAAGFREVLRATPAGFAAESTEEVRPPEELVVEEIVRFEGASEPSEEAVLFALASRDDALRGTFVSSFGPGTDPVAGELMRRLDDGARVSSNA
jgi:hypothetical protein